MFLWAALNVRSGPGHFVVVMNAPRVPTENQVIDYHLESVVYDGYDRSLGTDKSEHRTKHDPSPQAWSSDSQPLKFTPPVTNDQSPPNAEPVSLFHDGIFCPLESTFSHNKPR